MWGTQGRILYSHASIKVSSHFLDEKESLNSACSPVHFVRRHLNRLLPLCFARGS